MLLDLSAASGVPVRDLDWMARSRPSAFDSLWDRASGRESHGRRGETWEQARERIRAGRAANARGGSHG